MIPYKLDYTIHKVLENRPKMLTQSKTILEKVQDHKWYISERLGRDVGLLIATLDFLRNRNLPPIPRPVR